MWCVWMAVGLLVWLLGGLFMSAFLAGSSTPDDNAKQWEDLNG